MFFLKKTLFWRRTFFFFFLKCFFILGIMHASWERTRWEKYHSVDLKWFGRKVLQRGRSWRQSRTEKRVRSPPLGRKQLCLTFKDKPVNWNGETPSGFPFYQDFLSFFQTHMHCSTRDMGYSGPPIVSTEQAYRLRSHKGGCERQTGRRSSVSFKIWDQVNPSLKSLPFKGPNDRCNPPMHTALWTISKMAFCAVIHFSLTGSYFSKHDIIAASWLTLCSHY